MFIDTHQVFNIGVGCPCSFYFFIPVFHLFTSKDGNVSFGYMASLEIQIRIDIQFNIVLNPFEGEKQILTQAYRGAREVKAEEIHRVPLFLMVNRYQVVVSAEFSKSRVSRRGSLLCLIVNFSE